MPRIRKRTTPQKPRSTTVVVFEEQRYVQCLYAPGLGEIDEEGHVRIGAGLHLLSIASIRSSAEQTSATGEFGQLGGRDAGNPSFPPQHRNTMLYARVCAWKGQPAAGHDEAGGRRPMRQSGLALKA